MDSTTHAPIPSHLPPPPASAVDVYRLESAEPTDGKAQHRLVNFSFFRWCIGEHGEREAVVVPLDVLDEPGAPEVYATGQLVARDEDALMGRVEWSLVEGRATELYGTVDAVQALEQAKAVAGTGVVTSRRQIPVASAIGPLRSWCVQFGYEPRLFVETDDAAPQVRGGGARRPAVRQGRRAAAAAAGAPRGGLVVRLHPVLSVVAVRLHAQLQRGTGVYGGAVPAGAGSRAGELPAAVALSVAVAATPPPAGRCPVADTVARRPERIAATATDAGAGGLFATVGAPAGGEGVLRAGGRAQRARLHRVGRPADRPGHHCASFAGRTAVRSGRSGGRRGGYPAGVAQLSAMLFDEWLLQAETHVRHSSAPLEAEQEAWLGDAEGVAAAAPVGKRGGGGAVAGRGRRAAKRSRARASMEGGGAAN
eukprot:ctg_4021.g617